jgi:hypothetical protein
VWLEGARDRYIPMNPSASARRIGGMEMLHTLPLLAYLRWKFPGKHGEGGIPPFRGSGDDIEVG